jgi:hypothetical protein
MRRGLLAIGLRVRKAVHDVRRQGFVRVGPVYVTTWRRHLDAVSGGFELGREFERGQQREDS